MRVTKEWFSDLITHLDDDVVIDLPDRAYSTLRDAIGVKRTKDAPWPFPPDDVYPCRVFGKHAWGGNRCRHCDDPYPPEYAALIPKHKPLVQPLTKLLQEGDYIDGEV